mmetsp:Transcript_421/g.1299  ORF Transcript_421/g.1299 Transcript_421/m.1299 type:complete len:274 (+) Transcript_421:944-1765(+)
MTDAFTLISRNPCTICGRTLESLARMVAPLKTLMKRTARALAPASIARFKARDVRMKSKTAPWVTSVVEMRVTPWSKGSPKLVVAGTKKAGEIDETIETMAATVVDVIQAATAKENVRGRGREIEKIERRIAEDVRARVIVDRNITHKYCTTEYCLKLGPCSHVRARWCVFVHHALANDFGEPVDFAPRTIPSFNFTNLWIHRALLVDNGRDALTQIEFDFRLHTRVTVLILRKRAETIARELLRENSRVALGEFTTLQKVSVVKSSGRHECV